MQKVPFLTLDFEKNLCYYDYRIMTTQEQSPRPTFEIFSYAAFPVFASAKREARRFNSNYVGGEHIFLALIQDESVIQMLAKLNVDQRIIKTHIEESLIGNGEFEGEIVLDDSIPLSPEAKKIIELAVDEGRANDDSLITPIDLLIGVVRAEEDIVAGILQRQGGIFPSLLDQIRNLKPVIERERATYDQKKQLEYDNASRQAIMATLQRQTSR